LQKRMNQRDTVDLLTHRVKDYRPALPDLRLRLMRRPAYFHALKDHPPVAEQLALGLIEDLEAELRAPVFGTYAEHLLTACPELFVEILAEEPPRLHRPYVDGAVLRELLLFFAEDDGWQGRVTVRAVMARHFPLQLVAAEAVDGSGYTLGAGPSYPEGSHSSPR
jgi:hypothetical protein